MWNNENQQLLRYMKPVPWTLYYTWWCHGKETLRAVLAPCDGNPTDTGGCYPDKKPVMQSIDICQANLNKFLFKKSISQWFQMPL